MTDVHPGEVVETLGEAECRTLLSAHTFGRMVLTAGALPTVVPVSYCLMDDMVVVRVSPGLKLRTPLTESVVALEVDEIDAQLSSGWSVVAVGVANELRDPDRARAIELLSHRPGQAVDGYLVGIFPTTISGHRIASLA